MKTLLKIAGVAVLSMGLAACADSGTSSSAGSASTSGAMSHAQQCASVKNQMRMLDRSAPGAQQKLAGLNQQLETLNCGAK
tara:strand:+ start:43708 stop:43950 length:243 start_codon:yes stop_codon:yes gene_type:complete